MARHPFKARGIVKTGQGKWIIELDSSAPSADANAANAMGPDGKGANASRDRVLGAAADGKSVSANDSFAASLIDGTPVRLLFWPETSTGELTELETIAEVQQLDLSIVAHGLEAEGSLADRREEFINRLSSIEQ